MLFVLFWNITGSDADGAGRAEECIGAEKTEVT